MTGLPDELQTSPDLVPILILKQLLDASLNLVKDPVMQRALLESSFPKTFCEALTTWLVDRLPKRQETGAAKEGFLLIYKCLALLGNQGTTANRLWLRAFQSMLDGGMFSLLSHALHTIPDKDSARDSELANTLNAIISIARRTTTAIDNTNHPSGALAVTPWCAVLTPARDDWASFHREECHHAKVDYRDNSLGLRTLHALFTYQAVNTAEHLYNDFEAGLEEPLAEVPWIMVLDGWATTSPTVSAGHPNLHRLAAKPSLFGKAATHKGSSGTKGASMAVSTSGQLNFVEFIGMTAYGSTLYYEFMTPDYMFKPLTYNLKWERND
ncbi:hypothetical protein MD484_g5891, partial [Candolleomyces efflorescens]